jgi:Alginate lyase
MLSRRHFLATSIAALAATRIKAQTSHIDVAATEHDRILADIKTLPAPTTLIALSQNISTLTAAFVLTKDEAFAHRATPHLLTLPQQTQPAEITALIPIAEIAIALRFLVDAFDPTPIHDYLTALQTRLHTDPAMLLARDTHDHRASAWLLISSAIARSQRDEATLDANRRLFRKPTLRNQINADGQFHEELATPNPYRNTLFNFDLLTGACQLLASPFDLLWEYELPDGPGMRSVAAYLYPVIKDRNKWPSVSDAQHFHDLPGRRSGLLFAGRAYNRPEYVELWRTTPPAIPTAIAETFPIREPLLWTTRAQHGL